MQYFNDEIKKKIKKMSICKEPFNLLRIEFLRRVCYSLVYAKSEKENLNKSPDTTDNCQVNIPELHDDMIWWCQTRCGSATQHLR